MTDLLGYTYIFINLYICLNFWKKEMGVFQFPFLIACVSLTFVTPQLINLMDFGYFVDGRDEIPLLNLCLCNIFLTVAFNISSRKEPLDYSLIKFKDERAYKRVIYIFFLIGGAAMLMNRGAYKGGFVSGTFVIINFFASFATVALLLILIGFKSKILSGKFFIIIAIILILLTIDKILASGRRAATINLVLMLLYFFLDRNEKIYKSLKFCVPGFFLTGMIVGSQIGQYRENAYEGKKSLMENLNSLEFSISRANITLQKGEIYNAFVGMEALQVYGSYDFGAYNWNGIVKNYIPTVLVSRDFKDSLMFSNESNELVSYLTRSGSTMTGYFDSFLSFGLLGFIKFYVIGYIMGYFWRRREQSNISLMLYFTLLTPGLHLLTHSSNYFFSELFFILIIVYPVLRAISSKELITNTHQS